MDAGMKKTLGAIPLCKVKAGPRDGDAWKARLTEELKALIMVSSLSLSIFLQNQHNYYKDGHVVLQQPKVVPLCTPVHLVHILEYSVAWMHTVV